MATADRISQFIARLGEALRESAERGATPPVERRKLTTVLSNCGQRASSRLLRALEEHLQQAGIYAEPPLSDSGLRLDDWVLFSTGPFPPDSAFFPKERDLQRFVEACLGSGVFRNLEPFRQGGRASGWEFPLPNGTRVDLLCQERTRSGPGALVAIELKRDRERGTIQQVIEYIDALRQLYPSRAVKGLIISGREDQVAASLLRNVTNYDIEWLCYEVTFARVASTRG